MRVFKIVKYNHWWKQEYQIPSYQIQEILGQQHKKISSTSSAIELHKTNQPWPTIKKSPPTPVTPLQKLFQIYQLDKNTSYQQYSFATKSSLYDQIQETQDNIQKGWLPIKGKLNPAPLSQNYLQNLRQFYSPNVNIPGCVDYEDPNNFLQLRPIQEFRNTPIIPISQAQMKRHKQMLQRWHRKGFIFEIKKQTLINYFLLLIACIIMYKLLEQLGRKTKERLIQIQRKRKRIN